MFYRARETGSKRGCHSQGRSRAAKALLPASSSSPAGTNRKGHSELDGVEESREHGAPGQVFSGRGREARGRWAGQGELGNTVGSGLSVTAPSDHSSSSLLDSRVHSQEPGCHRGAQVTSPAKQVTRTSVRPLPGSTGRSRQSQRRQHRDTVPGGWVTPHRRQRGQRGPMATSTHERELGEDFYPGGAG